MPGQADYAENSFQSVPRDAFTIYFLLLAFTMSPSFSGFSNVLFRTDYHIITFYKMTYRFQAFIQSTVVTTISCLADAAIAAQPFHIFHRTALKATPQNVTRPVRAQAENK